MGWGAALVASSVGTVLFVLFVAGVGKWLISILRGWIT